MSVFKIDNLLLVLFLSPLELEVPVLVEVLVLLDVSLLDLLLFLLMSEHQLLILHVIFLVLELSNPVLSHFSL